MIMLICSICKERIEKPNEVYQISLDSLINNTFNGTITYYSHIDCLNENPANHHENFLAKHEILL
jgi:hypothetical protein